MTAKIPSHIRGFEANVCDDGEKTALCLKDSMGGEFFNILYYGERFSDYNDVIIGTDEANSLIIAESAATGEQVTLFDGNIHGYDKMFCEKNDADIKRPLKKAEFSPCRIKAEYYYGIDYDDEKDSYDFDENGFCILYDGRKMPWEQVKTDGYDGMALYYEDAGGKWMEFAEEELA